VELLIGGIMIAALCLIGVVAALVCWLFVLPFQILGAVFRGLAFLLALPFIALFAILGVVLFGAGLLVFLFPALPLVLIVVGIWLLMRRRSRTAATA